MPFLKVRGILLPPPLEKNIENKEFLEKYKVRWRFETNKRLDVSRDEIINLEVVRDF